ncbi:hypothetical protein TGARI_214860 [Toxoplasma gondii ARI]|uniref:Transmembrane protein n=1 Tax=Toxoplasma gondii ARI TaxID=1074872 RepID=A0A139XVR4_TOXGO|nr:hypothetical protein TGARI_214860 [Toxoplasma gondii ARI]
MFFLECLFSCSTFWPLCSLSAEPSRQAFNPGCGDTGQHKMEKLTVCRSSSERRGGSWKGFFNAMSRQQGYQRAIKMDSFLDGKSLTAASTTQKSPVKTFGGLLESWRKRKTTKRWKGATPARRKTKARARLLQLGRVDGSRCVESEGQESKTKQRQEWKIRRSERDRRKETGRRRHKWPFPETRVQFEESSCHYKENLSSLPQHRGIPWGEIKRACFFV